MFSKKIIIRKIIQIILHILFWCGVLLFFTYFFGFKSNDFKYVISFSLFIIPITIATTYVSIYKLIPDYLIKKQYVRFVIYSFYTFVISVYFLFLSIFFGLIFLSNFSYTRMPLLSRNIFFVMFAVYLIVIVVSAFKLLKLNLKQSEKSRELESKILDAQLKLKEQELTNLKSQIQPHFLFNTLNTIYGLALKQSSNTPKVILRLSNLMDYILYRVDKPVVSLQDEINYIVDYIELEKIRFSDRLQVDFDYNKIPKPAKIPPLILLPFVENSFKHGTLKNGKLEVSIVLNYSPKKLIFYIRNTSTEKEKNNTGIGLKNVKKRLALLFKNRHSLEIKNNTSTFEVHLTLYFENQ